jgi:hypothetical protein
MTALAQSRFGRHAEAEVTELAAKIGDLLSTTRLPVDTEQALQIEIGKLLDGNHIPHVREVKVSGGRIDFLAGYTSRLAPHAVSVGIECKIDGGARMIFRQCNAYCGDPRIGHLIVATGKALAMPPRMQGKPVTVVSLGRAWL